LLFFFIIFIVAEPQSSASCLELSAVADGDLLAGLSRLAAEALSGLDDVVAINDLSEDDVLSVEPGGLGGADEELGSVGVGTSVGHGQDSGGIVLELEVLILELVAVDGLASSSVVVGEVTALAHEVGDDPVEDAALVAESLLSSAEGTEVLCQTKRRSESLVIHHSRTSFSDFCLLFFLSCCGRLRLINSFQKDAN